jgi:hypothetical protein
MKSYSLVKASALLLLAIAPMAGAQLRGPTVVSDALREADARAIAEHAAGLLEANYLDASTGQAYAARLRQRAQSGAYDGLSGIALARRLTEDLREVKDDRHLMVRTDAPEMMGPQGPVIVGGPGKMTPQQGGQPMSPGPRVPGKVPAIEQAGWIAPGIAYIRFNEFPPDATVTQLTRDFLSAHASAKTLIFDLRTHRGGGPAQMDVIFPAIFSKPVQLVNMETGRGKDSAALAGPNLRPSAGGADNVKEYWVTPDAANPLQQARVFILTSNVTGSAGEMFVAALKWSGRATIVGAHTAGANHFGGMESLGGGLMLFLPVGRTFNPRDGKDWEGDGIEPDVDVAPERALAKALVLAGLPQADADARTEQYRPQLPMTRPSKPDSR